jgi:hypothetical protein
VQRLADAVAGRFCLAIMAAAAATFAFWAAPGGGAELFPSALEAVGSWAALEASYASHGAAGWPAQQPGCQRPRGCMRGGFHVTRRAAGSGPPAPARSGTAQTAAGGRRLRTSVWRTPARAALNCACPLRVSAQARAGGAAAGWVRSWTGPTPPAARCCWGCAWA